MLVSSPSLSSVSSSSSSMSTFKLSKTIESKTDESERNSLFHQFLVECRFFYLTFCFLLWNWLWFMSLSPPPRFPSPRRSSLGWIFMAIPLFNLSRNKSPVSRVAPSHWERECTWRGTKEDRSSKNLWLHLGLNPVCLLDRWVLYPLCYAPQAG